ncbi:MAG: PQQ-like beta-propeller repeat protein [Planctomycetes bacterium]|nr:PQQ-like beta-propeller repeat protein [Planctomycetota bacterium]
MKCISLVPILLLLATSVSAADWAQLRGPNFNGSTPEKDLPTSWSQTENIEWCVDLPGPSGATPIVSGDHAFVSSTNPANDTLLAMAFDRKSGELRWQHTVGKGIRKDSRSTFAAPTPATDGKVVIFFYGNGDMFAYDFDGKQLWKKNVGPFAFGWTFSSSPLLYGGKLYLQILQNRGDSGQTKSYILALDPRTGSQLWKHVRPSEAVGESLEAFNTPTPYEYKGRQQLLVNGGDAVTGHDLDSGKELWRWETWNPEKIGHWRLVPSPVAGEGVVLLCAPKQSPVYALPTTKSGRLSDDDLFWVSRDERSITSDVPTPAYYDGDFFILSKSRRTLSRVEPKTGKINWSTTLKSRRELEASVLAADGKIYLLNFDGEATVVNAADGEILSVIPMEEKEDLGSDLIRSSIIAAHGKLFIRTTTKLYCIGKS